MHLNISSEIFKDTNCHVITKSRKKEAGINNPLNEDCMPAIPSESNLIRQKFPGLKQPATSLFIEKVE